MLSATGAYPNVMGEALGVKVEQSISSQTSSSSPSEQFTPWTIPDKEDELQYQHRPNTPPYVHRYHSEFSTRWSSVSTNISGGSSEIVDDASDEWGPATGNSFEVMQRHNVYPDAIGELEIIPSQSGYLGSPAYILSGLTNVRPSRHRMATPFEQRLDDRINRLWGNYKTFASASSKGFGVSPLFGRTLSELFHQSRQMAENASPGHSPSIDADAV